MSHLATSKSNPKNPEHIKEKKVRYIGTKHQQGFGTEMKPSAAFHNEINNVDP